MNNWLEHSMQQVQVGEALITEGVDRLFRGWQTSSANVIGKLCTGAERWQRMIREIQAPANLAEILRTRVIL